MTGNVWTKQITIHSGVGFSQKSLKLLCSKLNVVNTLFRIRGENSCLKNISGKESHVSFWILRNSHLCISFAGSIFIAKMFDFFFVRGYQDEQYYEFGGWKLTAVIHLPPVAYERISFFYRIGLKISMLNCMVLPLKSLRRCYRVHRGNSCSRVIEIKDIQVILQKHSSQKLI